MTCDGDDFYTIVGTEVSVYRVCAECDELVIVNPEAYEKPKTTCDPGFCPYYVPYCLCEDSVIHSSEKLEECNYPDCGCGDGKQIRKP